MSVTTQECRAILEERQYQLQQAIERMKKQETTNPFENIIKQIKQTNTIEDKQSLKIWVKAIIQAPLSDLRIQESIQNPGFELVKVVLERLW